MHNRLRQKENSFLTVYSLPNGTLRVPSTLTHRYPTIIGVLQFNPLQLIDRFFLATCSKGLWYVVIGISIENLPELCS